MEELLSQHFQPGMFADVAGGASLFGTKLVYIIDTPSAHSDFNEALTTNLALLSESPSIFIIIEGSLLAPAKKLYAKHTEEVQEFTSKAGERFNTFSLSDALAGKDKKSLWLLLHEARMSGIALEEISGVLWWQLKSLRLAATTSTAGEAGMKDYPYNKAKRALGKFAEGELESLSRSLLRLQHDSRLGKRDFEYALERWVLSI